MGHNTNRRWLLTAACASLLVAGVMTYSPEAQACGGLFCDNAQPVNQAAERIIFSDNADDTVTALVQIMYEGPSENFAWVLPVPGTPEVEVSSDTAFDRLQQATNPTYRMNTTVEGTCDTPNGMPMASGADESDGSMNNGMAREEDDVEVVDSGQVGPYLHDTISVNPNSDDPADVAVDWLERNGYDVGAIGPEVIRPYLEDGMNLIAFKLNKESDDGDIRPIRITYDAELPMVPIKLTAVAANDDMGVLVWVLSEERAIPSNYKSLRLNEALIDWFNPANNYNEIINLAADEADGQGFVTEFAWPTDLELDSPGQGRASGLQLDSVVFGPQDEDFWSDIKTADWSYREGRLIERSQRYATWDGYLRVIDDLVPLPSDTTAEEFASCVSCSQLVRQTDIDGFSPQTFIDQLEAEVIEPVQKTQELISSRPFVTRMYTTMSAADMTLDPVFDFNASLGNYSHVHVAERIIECSSRFTRREAPWRAELPGGQMVFGTGNSWPLSPDDMPANHTIVREHTSGPGEVVVDNSATIQRKLASHNQNVTDRVSDDGIGCQTAEPASVSVARNVSLALMFGAFGLLLMRVRRRK